MRHLTKQLLYCGSSTDGYEYWLEYDPDDYSTGSGRHIKIPMGETPVVKGR